MAPCLTPWELGLPISDKTGKAPKYSEAQKPAPATAGCVPLGRCQRK